MDVNLQLVREFFELNYFRVLTNWQQPGEHRAQVFVENCNPAPLAGREFVLRAAEVASIERAVVEVRAWHGDRFYPSVIEKNPVLSDFVADEALAQAREIFGAREVTTILVISELPLTADLRARSIRMFQNAGINHVLEFPTVLQDLLSKVSVSGTYGASQTLQMIRLLKRYKFIRYQQMEFPFAPEALLPSGVIRVEAGEEVEEG